MEEVELIAEYVKNTIVANMFTCLPGIVENIDDYEKDQTVSVRPTVSKFYRDGANLIPPLLYKVPLIMPSAGGAILSFPVNVGDTVALFFSSREIDSWLDGDGDVVVPNSSRHHNLADAIAIPGLYPFSNSMAQSSKDVVIKYKSNSITLKENGDIDIDGGNINIVSSGSINLGTGGQSIARVGDTVQVIITSGSSAGTYIGTITSGGGNTST